VRARLDASQRSRHQVIRRQRASCGSVNEVDVGSTASRERLTTGPHRQARRPSRAAARACPEVHKNNTSPRFGAGQPGKPTNKTGLRGTRRHGRYHGRGSLLTSMYAGELGWHDGYGIMVPGAKEPLKSGRSAVRPRP
jgi:hypothetical protein